MKQIIIAQLTDTHIRAGGEPAYGKVDTAAFLRRAVEHLNRLDPQPDAVVVTGDLVDFGMDEEYDVFKELIAPLKAPFWVIPGNHDSARLWGAFPDSAERRAGEGLGYVVPLSDLQLLMFDSSVADAPHGDASEARCAWLEGVLAAGGDRPSLLFLHHPPFLTGIGHMDRNNCHQAERLAQVIARYDNLLAVGCGHVHRMITATVGGRRTLIAPSPAHAVTFDLRAGAPASFHLEPPAVLLHMLFQQESGGWSHVSHLSHIGSFPGPFPFFDENGALV